MISCFLTPDLILKNELSESLSDLKARKPDLNAGDIARLFRSNLESRGSSFNQGEILRRAIIFSAIQEKGLSPQETVKEFNFVKNSPAHSQAIVDEFAKKAQIEVVELEAKKSKLSNSVFEKDPEKRAKALEEKIIGADKQRLRGLMFDQIPDGSTTPESYSKIMERPMQQAAAAA